MACLELSQGAITVTVRWPGERDREASQGDAVGIRTTWAMSCAEVGPSAGITVATGVLPIGTENDPTGDDAAVIGGVAAGDSSGEIAAIREWQ